MSVFLKKDAPWGPLKYVLRAREKKLLSLWLLIFAVSTHARGGTGAVAVPAHHHTIDKASADTRNGPWMQQLLPGIPMA